MKTKVKNASMPHKIKNKIDEVAIKLKDQKLFAAKIENSKRALKNVNSLPIQKLDRSSI